MPGPVVLSAEWVPLTSYSMFRFGAPVEQYLEQGPDVLCRSEPPNIPEYEKAIRGYYRSDDLGCDVQTVGGVLTQVITTEVCLFGGINIVGSRVSAALRILGNPSVSWHIPEPDDPLERLGVIEDLGLLIDVPNETEAIYSVVLRPPVSQYLEAERSARNAFPNVTRITSGLLRGSLNPPPYDCS